MTTMNFSLSELTIATGNQGKLAEISAALADAALVSKPGKPPISVRSILATDPHFNPPEIGTTLRENAELKAFAAARTVGAYALADDTGLFVDALNGDPGIRAARYAGENCSFANNITKLLRELRGIPPHHRTARFICVLALSHPQGPTRFFEHAIEGTILEAPVGTGGFGYDPIFFIPSANKTFAEMTIKEKEAVSHRGGALKKFAAWLAKQE